MGGTVQGEGRGRSVTRWDEGRWVDPTGPRGRTNTEGGARLGYGKGGDSGPGLAEWAQVGAGRGGASGRGQSTD